MFPTIVIIALTAVIAIVLALAYFRNKTSPKEDIMAGVRERAEQRRMDRAFMNTTPLEDPYERIYDLNAAMSAVEVDESANGYGQLDEEQKRVIAAIFDSQAQVPTTLTASKLGVVAGSRWTHSVFGELNQLEPLREKDIWSNSRN
jgi:hypothetical protein